MSQPADLRELLLDLRHDLAKYLRFPLAMLPGDASEADVRAALTTALLRTRSTNGSTKSAEEIWQRFRREAGEGISHPGFVQLESAVQRALGWHARLAVPAPIPRAEVLADFEAVGVAIDRLLRR